jgi:excisionase family DNA binding protein
MSVVQSQTLHTKEEVALHFRVSGPTIDKWIAAKKIIPIRIGRRVLFDLESILKSQQAIQPKTATP